MECLTEPPLWHAEFTKEELVQKLSTTTKSADHLNGLLRETEATNAILMEQIKVRSKNRKIVHPDLVCGSSPCIQPKLKVRISATATGFCLLL